MGMLQFHGLFAVASFPDQAICGKQTGTYTRAIRVSC